MRRRLIARDGLHDVERRTPLDGGMSPGSRREEDPGVEQSGSAVGANLLSTAALWLLMLLNVSLPFFLGGVSEMGDLWFNSLGWSAVALWGGGLLQQRRFPRLSPWVAVPLGLALAAGTLAALNPEYRYEGPFGGFTAVPSSGWLPSTVDAGLTRGAVRHWALLCGLFWMSSDFCSRGAETRWYRSSLTVAGLLQIAVALGQRLAEARSILGSGWGEQLPFFGTFLYPGSAGAYLNALLPLFCFHVFAKTQRSLVGIAGVAGLAVAIFWNTSRLSSLVGVCTGVLLALMVGTIAWQNAEKTELRSTFSRRLNRLRPAFVSACLVGGLALLVFPVPPLFEKWKLLPEQARGAYPRFEAMKACFGICRDAGAWGFGPGTFAAVFPHYAQEMAVAARGAWRHAHCDYLEWFIEWGGIGGLLWSFLPLGAFIRVAVRFVREKSVYRRTEAACNGAALVALGLHALADFPVFNPAVQILAVFWLGNAWSAKASSGGWWVRRVRHPRSVSFQEGAAV